jgi:hypothetical protein
MNGANLKATSHSEPTASGELGNIFPKKSSIDKVWRLLTETNHQRHNSTSLPTDEPNYTTAA